MTIGDSRAFLLELFRSAVAAADPARCLPPHLPPAPRGRTVVVGGGKAAAAMARAVEDHWDGPLSGLVVTRYGHGLACRRIEVIEAAHPVPDSAGQAAAARMLELVHGLNPDDLVLALVSGGGSALLSAPAAGVSLADKQQVTRALLRSGAGIHEINCVRSHLSAIKGGRLGAAAAPARLVSLILSDVPGDDPAVVASGPTLPDPRTRAEARAVLERHRIEAPPAVLAWLNDPRSETPKPGDPAFAGAGATIVASARVSLDAAASSARERGIAALVLGDRIEGEAREVALVLAAIARSCAADGIPLAPPCVILSGGETTVTVRGKGRGGRNAEFLLAAALALDATPGIHAIACDTDGIDGSEENAGALIAPDTLARARCAGLDAAARLADNDAYGFFAELGDLVVTGPTRTNVNDFRAILVEARRL
ncbi:MAG: glycerate kinase [Betaproteobacteria bacterium CG2_30_68_42]|nr:MAG: glycerate kinase [Betaproteobacteria bacterium CG2_30_68_42]PIX74897.1 MAG: glycerate kinase [Rhodocyclales bacterium CG_4_10_14_3_um_filter_68_10]PJA56996.1 MAG: glycerate kinase [Rhodocyclales bacterium CG_4_9_14_3_um_filter_68_10]